MTTEEKTIKIAEACGYKPRMQDISPEFNLWLIPDETREITRLSFPKYFTDLNAMHEAEKVLISGQVGDYEAWIIDFLKVVSVPHASLATGNLYKLIHATAEQRAEAFGKTLNLWD